MTPRDPATAPLRSDLTWLRRRQLPRERGVPGGVVASGAASGGAASSGAAPGGPPRPSGGRIDYTRRDRPARAPATPPATPPPPARENAPVPTAASSPADLSLDLSSPSPSPAPRNPPPAPRPPAPAASSSSLDLSDAPAPPAPPTPASSSLDLSDAPAPPTGPPRADRTPPGRTPAPTPHPVSGHPVRRTRSGVTTLLDFDHPVVTLNRLQSGIGALSIDAAVGPDVGDLHLGCVYALRDGRSGTVEHSTGRRGGPAGRRPVVVGQRDQFDRIALDLRQVPLLERLMVYGFSPSRAVLQWGGTLVVTTFGGDRIDAPIVSPPSPAVMALLTVYNIGGEFVVRAEMDPVAGTVRDTARAFGYDRIAWLDDHTPVD